MSKPTPDSNTRNEALDIILDNYEVWLSWEGETLNNNHGKSRAETYEAISLLLQEAEDRGYRRGAIEELERFWHNLTPNPDQVDAARDYAMFCNRINELKEVEN